MSTGTSRSTCLFHRERSDGRTDHVGLHGITTRGARLSNRDAAGAAVGDRQSIIDGPKPVWPGSVAVGHADEARAAVRDAKQAGSRLHQGLRPLVQRCVLRRCG